MAFEQYIAIFGIEPPSKFSWWLFLAIGLWFGVFVYLIYKECKK